MTKLRVALLPISSVLSSNESDPCESRVPRKIEIASAEITTKTVMPAMKSVFGESPRREVWVGADFTSMATVKDEYLECWLLADAVKVTR